MANQVPAQVDSEGEPIVPPAAAAPLTPAQVSEIKVIDKEIRDQKVRVNKLKREEKGTRAAPGRFNPHLRAEIKLLSELYRLRWLMQKLPDPSLLKGAGTVAGQELSREMVSDLVTAEKAYRKLLEEGPAKDGATPKSS